MLDGWRHASRGRGKKVQFRGLVRGGAREDRSEANEHDIADVEIRNEQRRDESIPAVHGNDPNWGRILMAIGRSGARTNLDRARVWLGPIAVYRGQPLRIDEDAASAYLQREEVVLRADLGAGKASAVAWGCDLTPDYVHINSDYTT